MVTLCGRMLMTIMFRFILFDIFIILGWGGETSLAVQWLRLRLPVQGVWVQPLVRELRSHMLGGQKNRT